MEILTVPISLGYFEHFHEIMYVKDFGTLPGIRESLNHCYFCLSNGIIYFLLVCQVLPSFSQFRGASSVARADVKKNP